MSSLNIPPIGKHHHVVTDPQAFAKVTNIDRRKCHRVVPMEVLCLGLGRTGTNSLREALITLGYYDVYHFAALYQENPKDCEMWDELFEAKYGKNKRAVGRKDFDKLLGHCMAVTDAPCNLFSDELVEAYPDAKIILTLRDTPDKWYASISRTLVPYYQFMVDNSTLARFFKTFGPQFESSVQKTLGWCCHTYLAGWSESKDSAFQKYDENSAKVRELAKGRDYLEFNVKDGWEPLCKFLNKPVPNEPFPNINSAEQFEGNVAFGQKEALKTVLWNVSLLLGKVAGGLLGIAIGVYMYGSKVNVE